MKKIFGKGVSGRWRTAVALAMVSLSISAQSAWAAVLDYDRNIGADFTATYPVHVYDSIPVGNPFGPNSEWALRGENELISDLQTQGGVPASGQPGWCQQHGGVCDTGGPFTYFANPWQPGVTIDPTVNGHGPQNVLWTAPASVDAGFVQITGSIEQVFEPTREMRLSIFKNADASPFFFVDALPPIVNGVILQRVNFGPVGVAVNPGDTLKIRVFPSNSPPPSGAGIPTFAAWNLRLQESNFLPEPGSAMLMAIGSIMVGVFGRRWRS